MNLRIAFAAAALAAPLFAAPLSAQDHPVPDDPRWLVYAAADPEQKPGLGAHVVFVAGEQESVLTSEVVMRWRPDVASPMRFRVGARALLIRAAFDPDGQRRFLVCICEEFAA